MAFEPAATCPVCETVLAPDRRLEDHLCRNHTQAELAKYIVFEETRNEVEARRPILSSAETDRRRG